MPIIHISVLKLEGHRVNSNIDPAVRFAKLAEIDPALVTIHVHPIGKVYGNIYDCFADIFIPDIWGKEKKERMLKALRMVLTEKWQIAPANSIIMIHPLSSGHVMDRGKIETW